MDRNPRFRIWDLLAEKMVYFDFDDLVSGHCPVHPSCGDWEGVMRFSMMQDANGKDIYEGDILTIINDAGEKITVRCEFGVITRTMKSGAVCDISCFHFRHENNFRSFPIVYNYANKHDLEMMEIVGNICEDAKHFNIE